jgi:hypothetical protein
MKFLKELGIHAHNAGSSTGTKLFDNPKQILNPFLLWMGKIASVLLPQKKIMMRL